MGGHGFDAHLGLTNFFQHSLAQSTIYIHIVRVSRHTDLFVEVTNVTKGNGIWAHFASTRCFPSQIQMSRPVQKEDVQIETFCCIFKCIRVNWLSIIVTGISGTIITMPDIAYVSIFMDNDLTHITEDHFKIKLIARLLDQIYVVPTGMEETPKAALDIHCLW